MEVRPLVMAGVVGALWALAAGCEDGAPQPAHVDVTRADFYVASGERAYADQVADGFRPRPDRPGVRLVVPLDWGMDPFHDLNWRYQLQSWRMLDPIWDELLRTGDARLV